MERGEIRQPRRCTLPGSSEQALRDIADDPERAGSTERPELSTGARTYHLRFSRDRVGAGGAVKNPRHFLLFRQRDAGVLEVARVLHDAWELQRHLPEDYSSSPVKFHSEED
jgi:toxin ParE1/3/4